MLFGPRAHFEWQIRTQAIALGEQTLVMGIVNVTPDSFSDGGLYVSTERAVQHGLNLIADGADILDIGGESTRPGSLAGTVAAISAEAEQARVLPVIEALHRARPDAVLSIDTYRASTARAAVAAGAEIVNDVSGLLWDADMAGTCAELGCGTILMHTRGLPSAWSAQAPLGHADVVPLVVNGLQMRLATAQAAGVRRDRIVLDPGFGFGKRDKENWALLAGFQCFTDLGHPLLAGASRKGFLGLAATEPAARDLATHAAHTAAIFAGAHIVRVHDVRGAKVAAGIAEAVLRETDAVLDAKSAVETANFRCS